VLPGTLGAMGKPGRGRRWLRRGDVEIELVCGGDRHRISCDGVAIELLDHEAGDDERVLEALGGSSPLECFTVSRAWTEGITAALPRPLDALCRERWRSAGVASAALSEFEESLDDGPRSVQVRVGGMHPRIDAALWWEVLGRRPTPESVQAVLATRVDLSEAVAWSEALGGPISADAIATLQRQGIDDGYDARAWVEATGRIPDAAALTALAEVGVTAAYVALAWSRVHGGPITPDVVRRYRERGILDPEEHVARSSI
jgi:hypothetical protein